MTSTFDPYHLWLGIPPAEQPPNHYRLLGLTLFESNPQVIATAADRQAMLLHSCQNGQHAALTQQLLNEVSAAKLCLLNDDWRRTYDKSLARADNSRQTTCRSTEPARNNQQDGDDHSRRQLVQQSSSIGVSMMIHGVLFLILAVWTVTPHINDLMMIVVSPPPESEEALEEFDIEEVGNIEVESYDGAALEPQQLDDFTAIEAFSEDSLKIDPDELTINVEDMSAIEAPLDGVHDLFHHADHEQSTAMMGAAAIPGIPLRAATESEAVDGIAADILRRRKKGKLLTVWLFDASISLQKNREEAAKRLGTVFKTIDEELKESPFTAKNAVVAFGKSVEELVPPSQTDRNVCRAIGRIPIDNTGLENVMTSVEWAANRYRSKWQGQISIVIWTDESGDDMDKLESTIAKCKQLDVSVSVIGPTAVFQHERDTHQYVHLPTKRIYRIPVKNGPETALQQRIDMPRWGRGQWDMVTTSSGYAPFGLRRLTRETGGTYITFDRDGREPLPPKLLEMYRPDDRAEPIQQRDLRTHPLRQAVAIAVATTKGREYRSPPRMWFSWRWCEPAEFKRRFPSELKKERVYAFKMHQLCNQALQHLEKPNLKAAYEQETSMRWKAAYDLARGRLIRMSIRYKEYVELCDQIEVGDESNSISFYTSSNVRHSPSSRVKEAEIYLQRCVDNHPGTPWALLSQKELESKLGFYARQRL